MHGKIVVISSSAARARLDAVRLTIHSAGVDARLQSWCDDARAGMPVPQSWNTS